MGHQRGLARRFDRADIGEMVAVTLRPEMLDRRARRVVQQPVRCKALEDRCIRTQLLATRTSARSEMSDRMHGVEQYRWSHAGKHRDGHGAADVGRVHARMYGFRHRNAADRNGTRWPCRTGIGHDRAGANHGSTHQHPHAAGDCVDVRLLIRRFGLDVEVERDRAGRVQRHCRRRRETKRGLEGFGMRCPLVQEFVGCGERGREPLALPHAGVDQILSAQYFFHVSCFQTGRDRGRIASRRHADALESKALNIRPSVTRSAGSIYLWSHFHSLIYQHSRRQSFAGLPSVQEGQTGWDRTTQRQM